MRYTSHQEEAIDVLNRAFLKVFNSIDKYKPTGSLGGWIARIVFNTSIDYVRSKTKYKSVMDFNTEKDISIEAEAIEQLYAEDLYQLVQRLPENTRAVFSLYVVDGYKHREIAKMLNISLNTSKWHLAKGKEMLKAELEKLEVRRV
jgi:RNA polymerase sigma-70 factor (ECF subfamily)